MHASHPRIDERFCWTLLLLLLSLLWCCRLITGRITGARRGRPGALIGLGQRRTAARRRRQRWRQRGWRLFVDEGTGGRQRHGGSRRRSVRQRRGGFVMWAQTVMQSGCRLVLESTGRVPHRRSGVSEPGMREDGPAVATQQLLVHAAEPGDVRGSGRSAGRVIIIRLPVHDVTSGRRVWRHRRGGRKVLARDRVGRRRLAHAGVDEVRAHCGQWTRAGTCDVFASLASSRHRDVTTTMM